MAHEFLEDLGGDVGGVAAAEAFAEGVHGKADAGLVGEGADEAAESLSGEALAALALEVEDFRPVPGKRFQGGF
jgi:hypothetical protein